jgi:hypothetical protein
MWSKSLLYVYTDQFLGVSNGAALTAEITLHKASDGLRKVGEVNV